MLLVNQCASAVTTSPTSGRAHYTRAGVRIDVGAFEGKLPAETRLASPFRVSVAEARPTILDEAFPKIPTPRDSGNGHALVVCE
jgi:hypothetical protein